MGFVLEVQNWEFKKMGFPPFLVLLAFFLVSQLLVIHSSGSCPSSFDCGPLDPIKFPFTSNQHPLCGWYNVSCDEPVPKVKLGEEGKSYQVSSLTNDTIKFNDPGLKTLIESNNICNLFSYINPLMALNTPSISFTISPNLTLFKCDTSNPVLKDQTNKHFFGTYSTYTGTGGPCPGYTVYHSHPNQQIPLPTPDSYPPNCNFIQLPVVSSFEDWDPGDPFTFTLLTSNFSVGYHLSKECLTCLDDGGQCLRDRREFECLHERGGRKRFSLILGTEGNFGYSPSTCKLLEANYLLKKASIDTPQS